MAVSEQGELSGHVSGWFGVLSVATGARCCGVDMGRPGLCGADDGTVKGSASEAFFFLSPRAD